MKQLYHMIIEETSVSTKMKLKGEFVTSMNAYNEKKNTYVRIQMLNALLDMLKEQDIQSIAISDLIEKANVSRVSFYRNYSSKEDILIQEENRLFSEWKYQYDLADKESPQNFTKELLNYYQDHSNFYQSLYAAGLENIIINTIIQSADIKDDDSNTLAYFKSSIAYMVYGWVHEWMKRGMQETGTVLAAMIDKELKH